MSDDRDTRNRASIAELDAGRLPLAAQERLRSIRADAAFTSDLSVNEHLAIRSVGFFPVGQVLGCCVYRIGYTGMWDCGARGGTYAGQFRSAGMYGGYVRAVTTEVVPLRRALLAAKTSALNRLLLEAAALDADGVVAVRFTERQVQPWTVEFEVIGTAVRSTGTTRATRPFTSDLSGQDFARLVRTGWVPTALVLGVGAVIRHDDYATRATARSWSNVEVEGYTDLLHESRAVARSHLAREAARSGAEGLVLQAADTRIREHECQLTEGRDHVAETHLVGTAIVRVPHASGNNAPRGLTVMPVRDSRRRAAHLSGGAR